MVVDLKPKLSCMQYGREPGKKQNSKSWVFSVSDSWLSKSPEQGLAMGLVGVSESPNPGEITLASVEPSAAGNRERCLKEVMVTPESQRQLRRKHGVLTKLIDFATSTVQREKTAC